MARRHCGGVPAAVVYIARTKTALAWPCGVTLRVKKELPGLAAPLLALPR